MHLPIYDNTSTYVRVQFGVSVYVIHLASCPKGLSDFLYYGSKEDGRLYFAL